MPAIRFASGACVTTPRALRGAEDTSFRALDGPAVNAPGNVYPRRSTGLAFLLPALALAILGGWILWVSTRNGVGLAIDSFDYFSAAEMIADGVGIGRMTGSGTFRPMTHFPPLYSITLAAFEWSGAGSVRGARWLNIFLFAVTIFLSASAVRTLTRSPTFAFLGAAFILASETMIDLHIWALSEPLYLCLALGGLLGVASYIAKPRRRSVLLLSSGLVGAAWMTRYVGISLAVIAGTGLALIRRRSWRIRIGEFAIYVGLAILPILAWLARNVLLTGNPVDRPPAAWHPPSLERLQQGSKTILNWVLPDALVDPLQGARLMAAAGALTILAVMLVAWYLRAMGPPKDTPESHGSVLSLTLTGYAVAYLVVVSLSVLGFDRITPLDGRILSPLLLVGLILLSAVLALAWQKGETLVRALVAGLAVLFLAFQAYRAAGVVRRLQQDAQGYSSSAWRNSPTIGFIRELDDVPIFTNDLPAIYFLAGRISSYIPTDYNPAAAQARADYQEWLNTMRATLKAEEGVLVIFGGDPLPIEPEHLADLTEGLVLAERFPDGAVFESIGEE